MGNILSVLYVVLNPSVLLVVFKPHLLCYLAYLNDFLTYLIYLVLLVFYLIEHVLRHFIKSILSACRLQNTVSFLHFRTQ